MSETETYLSFLIKNPRKPIAYKLLIYILAIITTLLIATCLVFYIQGLPFFYCIGNIFISVFGLMTSLGWILIKPTKEKFIMYDYAIVITGLIYSFFGFFVRLPYMVVSVNDSLQGEVAIKHELSFYEWILMTILYCIISIITLYLAVTLGTLMHFIKRQLFNKII